MTDEYAERAAFIDDQVELSRLRTELAVAKGRIQALETRRIQALETKGDLLAASLKKVDAEAERLNMAVGFQLWWSRAWKRAAKDTRRRKKNLQASHDLPRLQDVAQRDAALKRVEVLEGACEQAVGVLEMAPREEFTEPDSYEHIRSKKSDAAINAIRLALSGSVE